MRMEISRGARRDLGAIETLRDAEVRLRERIVVPPDAADDRNVIGDKRFGFEPLPAEFADARRDFRVIDRIAVVAVRPKLVVAGDEEPGAFEVETRQTSLERIAVGDAGITDDNEHIAAGLI